MDTEKITVLVIEDDPAVRNLLTTTLSAYGYQYRSAANGEEAIREAVALQPDLFLLDLGLPDMDGNDIIRRVRNWTDNPIIVVSARTEITDKVEALDAGADDYLTKPFSTEELLARIRAAARRLTAEKSKDPSATVYENGGLRIDYVGSCVYMDGEEIHLTPIEYKLLILLAKNTGKILTHNYILNEVWNNHAENDTRSLRVFMATLRKKIEKDSANPQYLQTHIGIGYRLVRMQGADE